MVDRNANSHFSITVIGAIGRECISSLYGHEPACADHAPECVQLQLESVDKPVQIFPLGFLRVKTRQAAPGAIENFKRLSIIFQRYQLLSDAVQAKPDRARQRAIPENKVHHGIDLHQWADSPAVGTHGGQRLQQTGPDQGIHSLVQPFVAQQGAGPDMQVSGRVMKKHFQLLRMPTLQH